MPNEEWRAQHPTGARKIARPAPRAEPNKKPQGTATDQEDGAVLACLRGKTGTEDATYVA